MRALASRVRLLRPRRPSPAIVLATVALVVASTGTAVAASGLIHASDIATGAVASRAIRDGGVALTDLSSQTRASLAGGTGATGAKGETGSSGAAGTNGHDGANGADGVNGAKGSNGTNGTNGVDGAKGLDGTKGIDGTSGTNGSNGANGPNGANGANGAEGPKGTNGANGANGANGPNGANGANGVDGTNGKDGTDGTNGTNGAKGTDGTNGINGTVKPLAAKQGITALPTGPGATTVVELVVPAGNYVIFAKSELSHTGAGDSVECILKAGATSLDQVAMKTLPALAAIPASMQAVATTVGPATSLTVQCTVAVANGSANFNSLIAIPTA